MQDEREVSYDEALNFAREENFGHYVETSAKTGQNVQELFQTLTKHFYINHENNLDRFVSTPWPGFSPSHVNVDDVNSLDVWNLRKTKTRMMIVSAAPASSD